MKNDSAAKNKKGEKHEEKGSSDKRYQVEYNREKWDIWLKGCITNDLTCMVVDLIPGSYYRFRVRTINDDGVSEPSPVSEPIFLGAPIEDEVFGLPGGNYPKENHGGPGGRGGRLFNYGHSKPTRRHLSWDNIDTSAVATATTTSMTTMTANESSIPEEDANKSFQGQ